MMKTRSLAKADRLLGKRETRSSAKADNNSRISKKTITPKKDTYECCSTKFYNKRSYNRHSQEKHAKKTTTSTIEFYECCDTKFHDQSSYDVHLQTDHPKEPNSTSVIINECHSTEDNDESSNDQHQQTEPKKENSSPKKEVIECCNTVFRGISSYDRHRKLRHSATPTFSFKCKICLEKFEKRGDLRKHKKRVHSKGEDKESEQPSIFPCEKCTKVFSRKDNLNRHVLSSHENDTHTCEVCKKQFSRKDVLDHHRLINPNCNVGEFYSCADCNKTFSRKCFLVRHILNHLNIKVEEYDNRKIFNCADCNRSFSRKFCLLRHIKIHLRGNSEHVRLANVFCAHCEASFTRKDALFRHISRIHRKRLNEKAPDILECQICHRSYRTESCLLQHAREQHGIKKDNEEGEGTYECAYCSIKLANKNSLKSHFRSVHFIDNKEQQLKRKVPTMRCLNCDMIFRSRRLLVEHYKLHGIELEYEYLTFNSREEFDNWLNPCYNRSCTWKTAIDAVFRFRCHRSGVYQAALKENGDMRKRRLKLTGSKKLQGFCPGEVTLRERLNDGFCSVTVQKTHIGHSIDDVEELRHIYLSRVEKEKVARKLMEGVPKETVLREVIVGFHPNKQSNQRLELINSQDLRNIAQAYGVKALVRKENSSDHDSISKFFSENEYAILYFKQENEPDHDSVFEDEEFVLIFQDESQKESLLKYGEKVVAVDYTRGSPSNDFILHTLVVFDDENEGIAAAFLVSNRCDQVVVDLFIQCIRNNAGLILPKTLICDIDNMYMSAWHSIMAEPTYSLYSQCQIRDYWRRQLNQMIVVSGQPPNSKYRQNLIEDLRVQLFDLADELNENKFFQKLTEFISIEDEISKPFLDNFFANFTNNSNMWASCYRVNAGENINKQCDIFHRTLKYKVGNRKKIATFETGVYFIQDYIKYRILKCCAKVRPTISTQLRALRLRHSKAELYAEKQPIVIEYDPENQAWQVGFFSGSNEGVMEIFFVQPQVNKKCSLGPETCELLCELCNCCIHEYQCNCYDATVANNMCKHIHALCIFLRGQEENTNTIDEIDSPYSPPEESMSLGDEPMILNDESVISSDEPMILSDEPPKSETNDDAIFDDTSEMNVLLETYNEIDAECDLFKEEVKSYINFENCDQWCQIREKLRNIVGSLS